jgi:hypothetical protein
MERGVHLRRPGIVQGGLGLVVALTLAIGLVELGLPGAAVGLNVCGEVPVCATLTVTLSGNGTGSIQSTDSTNLPDGLINCRTSGGIVFGTCSHTYDVGFAPATLTISYLVTAAPGSWICSAPPPSCQIATGTQGGSVVLPTTDTVSQFFALSDAGTITVTKLGPGTGTVTSSPIGIDCGARCSAQFEGGSTVVLSAVPNAGSKFVSWTGGQCAGQPAQCSLQGADDTERPMFEVDPNATPTPGPTVAPSPTPSMPIGPTVSVPAVAFHALGLVGSTTVPAIITWSARPGAAPILAYDLQVATNGGSWVEVGLASALTTRASVNLRLGASTQFRVRAADASGHTGPWTNGPTEKTLAYEENSSTVTYGGSWSTETSTSDWGGHLKAASHASASATFHLTGRGVAIVASRGPTEGSARVYVDGVLVTTLNLHATVASVRQIVFTRAWSSAGSHTVKLVVLGTSGHPAVDLDGFAILH